MKKFIVEFIGTFFLVLTVIATVNGLGSASFMAPLAIGAVLMVMVYAGGYISGGHFNPAVSLGVLLRGHLSTHDFLGYVVSQGVGAVLASLVATSLLGFSTTAGTISFVPTLIAEILGTFALVRVVLHTATTAHVEKSFYGLAIGGTLMAMIYAFGGISGGAFNPAVALGASVSGMLPRGNLRIYLVACFAGGILAALVFDVVMADDHKHHRKAK